MDVVTYVLAKNKISEHDSSNTSHQDIRTEVNEVREIASGLTTNYVCSSVTNPVLDSENDVITLATNLTDINGNIVKIADLKIGDNIYISELNVFDRWYAGNNKLYKLTTSKEAVHDVMFNGSSVVQNDIATIPKDLSAYNNDADFIDSMSVDNKIQAAIGDAMEDRY